MAQIVSSETLDYLTFKNPALKKKNPALIKVKFRLSEVWLLKLSGIKKKTGKCSL